MHGEMVNINDVDFGVSRKGMEAYIQDLNTKAITETCSLLRDGVDGIENALIKGWQGQAEENFMTNFRKAVTETTKSIEALKDILKSEFESIEDSVANQDKEMVPLE